MANPRDSIIPVPYRSRFTHSPVEPGQTIFAQGTILEDAQEFQLNLLSGTQTISPQGVVALHVNVRFDENKIVINSFEGGEWGKEVRTKNPFHKGAEFDLRIRVHEDRYEILVQGKEVAEFPHRIALKHIDHLEVCGDVRLNSIRRGGRYHTLPFESRFHNGHLKAGEIVLINGIPNGNRFEVDFLDQHNNILFHFNPRLDEKKVVRSAFIQNEWGVEEREGTQPFKKDTAFDLVIQNQPYSIQLFVNGCRFGSFAHRTADPGHDYERIRVSGNVELTGLEVSYPHGGDTVEY